MRASAKTDSTSLRMGFSLLLVALLGLLFEAPQSAFAQSVSVFHSPADDGLSSTLSIPLGSTATVYLYVDGGTAPSAVGQACETGSGDELCAIETTLSASGGVTLLTFTPATDAQGQIVAGVLRANRVDAVAGVVGPTKIGELQIDTSVMGTLELQSGAYVDAALQLQGLTQKTILYVPEPSFPTLLGPSLLFLPLLLLAASRRGRSLVRN